jgi:hypothetical protein
MCRSGRLVSSLTLAIFLGGAVHANAEPGAMAPRPGAPKMAAKTPANELRRSTAGGLLPGPPKASPAPTVTVTSAPSATLSAAPSSVPSAVPSSVPSAVPSSAPSSPHPPIAAASSSEVTFVLERVVGWCTPASDFRSVLRSTTCAASALALAGGIVGLVLEVDRVKMRSGLDSDYCSRPIPQPRIPRCRALYERVAQRNVAMGIMFGATALGALAGGALGLRFLLDRRDAGPSIAPAISTQGGGIIVTGAF